MLEISQYLWVQAILKNHSYLKKKKKKAWHWHQNRCAVEEKRGPRNRPMQLQPPDSQKHTLWGKKGNLFNKWCWEN
jgi:hypothetical protein